MLLLPTRCTPSTSSAMDGLQQRIRHGESHRSRTALKASQHFSDSPHTSSFCVISSFPLTGWTRIIRNRDRTRLMQPISWQTAATERPASGPNQLAGVYIFHDPPARQGSLSANIKRRRLCPRLRPNRTRQSSLKHSKRSSTSATMKQRNAIGRATISSTARTLRLGVRAFSNSPKGYPQL